MFLFVVEVLENSHKEEIEKRNEAIKKHNEDIKRLEENYSGKKENLSVEKRSRYLELVKMYDSDPESINKILEKEFGFKYEK